MITNNTDDQELVPPNKGVRKISKTNTRVGDTFRARRTQVTGPPKITDLGKSIIKEPKSTWYDYHT